MKFIIPQSEQELLQRAQQLAGLNLQQLAEMCQFKLPPNLLYAKGIIGQLLEKVLGATAGVKSKPDFEHLAIELKSIPVNTQGKPTESTYVCVVPMTNIVGLTWRESSVYHKLARVLWVPIQADEALAIAERKIGMPLLWQMPSEIEQILRQDWEELMELVSLGKVETITGRQGVYLQIRPKAEDSKALTTAIGTEGKKIQTLPRGFYLRAKFTEMILKAYYL
jgi:DNA mismatch repair protein MutH